MLSEKYVRCYPDHVELAGTSPGRVVLGPTGDTAIVIGDGAVCLEPNVLWCWDISHYALNWLGCLARLMW